MKAINPWNARFGWFWYYDSDLFDNSNEAFELEANRLSDAGINTVITFSNTHARWDWYPYWTEINRTIKRVVDACHKVGIRVIEHHSCSLTISPIPEEKWHLYSREFQTELINGLKSFNCSDPDLSGLPFSSLFQIDGRTGDWARSNYDGNCICYNNPDFRRIYFSYLEDIYQTGVDGIMTDDVQYFGEGNACTCIHCRKLFKEWSGYELPAPGIAWEHFHGDYENQIYIAWEKFRRESTANFQLSVNEHFEYLGLSLLRPNYVSDVLFSNPTAYPFDAIASIWDWIFQENGYVTLP